MALDENMDKIREIIASAEEEIKSIEVEKDIPLELDLGNLLVTDNNEIDKGKFSDENEVEEYLKSLARDGVQNYRGEKTRPKPKPLTKWEQYAKEKGIKKTKKPTKIWDEILKNGCPNMERKKNWVLEVPENADPFEDQFRKMSEKKKERVARNEYQRLSNIARAKNVKVPKLGVTSETMKSKFEMKTALEQTRLSTASLGKFQKTLQKEKPLPERKRGEKRKLPATNNSFAGIEQERKRSLTILSKMKKSELDYEMAVNKQIKMENVADVSYWKEER
ncbi:Ribosome biogenesis regulatory protein-like [Armadillidium vulgare]|nr:Ribosome biogenesis regulatory protein-like [Armadillidium vulgare]